jgi:hypothetical protein
MKNRLQALSLLDRALAAMTDDELEALVASLPDDHRSAIDKLCGAREGGFETPAARTLGIRATAARGRMSGALEQLTTVLTDPALADCITVLGDHSDNPTEEQLAEVTPGLIERHGLATMRLTFSASVAGEAAASVLLIRLLKHDPVLALPEREAPEAAPTVLVRSADDETKARRKALKERKQADARQRREQQARARS